MNPHLSYPRDTDQEGQFDPAMPWYSRVAHLFDAIPDGAFILDVGCNSGGFGRRLLSLKPHCRVYGVDLAKHFLPLARAKGYGFCWHEAAESLPLAGNVFEYVILSEILEHADDPRACVREARRVLRPGGILLGDVPTAYGRWGYRSLRGHKWHRRCYRRSTLTRLLESEFQTITVHAEPRWPTRHFLLPQWQCFKAWGRR